MKKIPTKRQEEQYNFILNCSEEELESYYNAYAPGYPTVMGAIIKVVATLRNIDTSKWHDFYR